MAMRATAHEMEMAGREANFQKLAALKPVLEADFQTLRAQLVAEFGPIYTNLRSEEN
jgi:hypothetical protein